MQVVLTTTEDGQDQPALTLEGTPGTALALTPSQARAMATDLITAVNRAEVRANLKVSPNFWRRSRESSPRLQVAG